ncbi:MAG: deoxyribodipyrimidine photo-lyase [Bryobacterales bacterium]|nr:deoxyribodipyrimidine photo-lyase [Bryobacterales bacterium]
MQDRVFQANAAEFRPGADYVLYWCQANRRVESNHALLFAAHLANERDLPLLVLHRLTFKHHLANDRLHTFALEGVPALERDLRAAGAGFCFYLQRTFADNDDVFFKLASRAAAVVTDDFPTSSTRKNNEHIANEVDCPYFQVDSSCVVPMRKIEKKQYAAYTLRPRIHRALPNYLTAAPGLTIRRPFTLPLPTVHTGVTVENIPSLVASCAIDHGVKPSISFAGGREAAEKHLHCFLDAKFRGYAEGRNEPSKHVTSNLSPYLHFGYISSLEVALAAKERAKALDVDAESFLEELIVRRELAFNHALFSARPDCLKNLPEWALDTLRTHAKDPRDPSYERAQFENAETHDALWNATQKEMRLRGKIHGYYRMYWGKKIIEWSPTCQDALETMIHIHDRYALDGRDPNTYTSILWCFGLHDRPWQERPIFGKVRYMALSGMERKTDVGAYLKEIEILERTGKDPFRVE